MTSSTPYGSEPKLMQGLYGFPSMYRFIRAFFGLLSILQLSSGFSLYSLILKLMMNVPHDSKGDLSSVTRVGCNKSKI